MLALSPGLVMVVEMGAERRGSWLAAGLRERGGLESLVAGLRECAASGSPAQGLGALRTHHSPPGPGQKGYD